MALIDLSKFDVQVNNLPVDKQVYSDQGAGAYKAMADLGKGVAGIATEMYAKHMDVFTDREAMAGEEKYKISIAEKQKELLLNIDEDTDLIKGTEQTYEEAMADYITSERTRIGDSLTESQSRNKFSFAITPVMSKDLIDSSFKSAEITSKNTLTRAPKKYSEASNIVLGSDSMSVQRNLDAAIVDTDKYVQQVAKTSGLTVAQKVRKDGTTSLVKSAMEASLRNIATGDDRASLDFSAMLGVGTMFKTKGEYKKFIMQTYEDTAVDAADLEKKAEQIASSEFVDTNARLLNGHPEINLLSPEEKASYLKRALDTKFKIKAEAEDAIALKMSDWKAHPSRDGATAADIPAWIAEGARNMTNPGYKGDNTTRIRDAYEAADMQVVQDSVTNELTKGRTGFDDFLATSNARREAYVKAILVGTGVMTEKEFNDAKAKNPSVGDKYALGAESKLRAKQAELNLKAARDPLYFVQSIPENNAIAAQAVRVVNGKIVVDNTNLALMDQMVQDKMKQVGTVASALESSNILPDGQLNDIATVLQLSSPTEQIDFYKRLNQSPKLALKIYSQLLKQNKITPEQAATAVNLSMGDSKTADALNANLISVRNKYTKDARVALIEGLKTEGFMGKDMDYKDVKEMTETAIGKSKYMNGLKTIAKSSGMTDAEINNIYQNDAIQVLVLDKLSKTLQEDTSTWDQLTGGLTRKVERATEEVIQEYYGSRIKPINSANLNVITLPEGVDEGKVTVRATNLANTIKEELKSGRLQVDFGDYQGMQKAKKYAGLSQDMRQKYWLRDVAEDISFNGTDVTGKSQEIVAMFKDTNGQYYRLKLKTPNGKSFVPVIKNVRELQNADPAELHTKYFAQGVHTPQLAKPTNRVIKPAPNTKVTPANIADDVMNTISGSGDHSVAAQFLKKHEGFVENITDDGYGNPAVGHGHTPLPGEKFDKPLTAKEADELLISDIKKHQGGHMKKIKVSLNQNEKAAITSLAINTGANSTAVKEIVDLVNAGRKKEAAKKFLDYGKVKNKKTGEMTEDLMNRRKAEKELFETPVKKKGK